MREARTHGSDARCACGVSLAGRHVQARRCHGCAADAQRATNAQWMRARRRAAGMRPAKRVTPLTAELMRETRARCGWSYREIAADFGVDPKCAWKHARGA